MDVEFELVNKEDCELTFFVIDGSELEIRRSCGELRSSEMYTPPPV